jgi:cell division protein FtsB
VPSSRPSSPRGSRARGGSHPTGPRAGARPASRPGQRPGGGRSRPSAQRPLRPRLTGRAVVLVLVLAVLAVSYASSMRAYLEQKEHLEALREQIEDSRENIATLKREKRRWRDPAYQEAQATERLGMVKPGEIAFHVIDEDGDPLDHDDSLVDPAAIEAENEPAWWETAWQTVETAGNPEDVPDPVEEIDLPKKRKR